MADHLALYSNRLLTPPTLEQMHKEEEKRLAGEGSSQQIAELYSNWAMDGFSIKAECRICQEDDLAGNMEAPCACNGSLKVNILFHSCSNYLSIEWLVISRLNDN